MNKSRRAFTLVELMLVTTFLSTLFVTVAVLVKFLIATYQRGVTINSVNSAGRHVIDDISKSIAASPARSTTLVCRDKIGEEGATQVTLDKCTADEAYRYTFYQKYGLVNEVGKTEQKRMPLYGAFCTGKYSYIWNSGYFFNKNYQVAGGIKPVTLSGYNNPKPIHLLRIQDPKRNICAGHVNSEYEYTAPNNNQVEPKYTLEKENKLDAFKDDSNNSIKLAGATELIGDSEGGVAIYDLRIFAPAIHGTTNQSIYSGTMILATTMGKVDIGGYGDYCKEPSTGFTTEFNYCAINKFNFAARSLGQMRSGEQLERNIYEKDSKGY